MPTEQYAVTHLRDGQTFLRPYVLQNRLAADGGRRTRPPNAAEAFHKTLPNYNVTKLHSLPGLAAELGLANVYLKDESDRFGLPAFKILGASWAVHKAICSKLGVECSSIEGLKGALAVHEAPVELVACTEGNWGRAVARISRLISVPVRIYVPGYMSEATKDLIRGEGADVVVVENGTYDDAVARVQHDAATTGALIMQDVSFDGYDGIPTWVAEGYSTMLWETDRQVAALSHGKLPDVAIASVGAGSWAQAVASHYKSAVDRTVVVGVEPDTATSLKESLHYGANTSVQTAGSIMCGMNCGTIGSVAWPVLRDGVDIAVAVTDAEAHKEVLYLQTLGIDAGPCGAATVAALRRLVRDGLLSGSSGRSVVLFSTEAGREYRAP